MDGIEAATFLRYLERFALRNVLRKGSAWSIPDKLTFQGIYSCCVEKIGRVFP